VPREEEKIMGEEEEMTGRGGRGACARNALMYGTA